VYFLICIKVRSGVGKSLDLHQVDSNLLIFDISFLRQYCPRRAGARAVDPSRRSYATDPVLPVIRLVGLPLIGVCGCH
jgi:hypothetical protein